LFDIFSLSAFVATKEKQHDRRTNLAEIDSVAWTVIDAEFLHPITHAMTVSEIAEADSI